MSTAAKPQTKTHQPTLRQRAAASRAAAANLLAQAAADEAAAFSVSALPPPAEIATCFDVGSMSMFELQSLARVSEQVTDLCVAVSCQPRAEAETPAGLLVRWIEETLEWVSERCVDEAAARKPEPSDIDTRLKIIARRSIENGDPEEMLMLATGMIELARAAR